jgi:hypothetical protein
MDSRRWSATTAKSAGRGRQSCLVLLAEGACIATVPAFRNEGARNTEVHEQNGFPVTGDSAVPIDPALRETAEHDATRLCLQGLAQYLKPRQKVFILKRGSPGYLLDVSRWMEVVGIQERYVETF